MGWTGMELPAGLSKLQRAIAMGDIDATKVVASSEKGIVLYVAYRGRGDEVFGLVILVERKGGMTYTKPMDEGMGPYYHEASAAVLNALTPTDNVAANAWRDGCRATLARIASAPKFKVGDRVVFARDTSFGRHGYLLAGTEGTVLKTGSKNVVLSTTILGNVRMTKTGLHLATP